jgi:hypothetical protein
MQRLVLKITDQTHKRVGDTHTFRVRGNGILFEQLCPNHELDAQKLLEINENFKSSLRFVKHTGGWPSRKAEQDPEFPQRMRQAMNLLSSTDTGFGIKIKDDPLKEYVPFKL